MHMTTDYARANHTTYNTTNGNGCWWLRSPSDSNEFYATEVSSGGYTFDINNSLYGSRLVNYAYTGVSPALCISF